MYKYIITWIVVSIQSAPCPDANKRNEFGVMGNSNMTCAVYHFQEVKEKNSKAFIHKDSCKVFLSRLYNYQNIGKGNGLSINGGIQDVKLDSIWVNK
jgi:hypothetical protein